LIATTALGQTFSSTGIAANNIVGILGASLIVVHLIKE
jgi:hypothetical protein